MPPEQVGKLQDLARLISGQMAPHTIAPDDWPELIRLAERHELGPLLLWTVERDQFDTANEPQWQELVWARRLASVRFAVATRAVEQTQEAFSAAGIPCIWLKGFVLASSVYPGPELRPMIDVDVLVPYAARERAAGILLALGYQRSEIALFEDNPELKFHYSFWVNSSGIVTFELHFHLLDAKGDILSLAHLDWFWQQTETRGMAGFSFGCLKPEAHLLYLCAHAILQHGEADLRLRRYFDLHLLITHTPDFDWRLLVDQAAALRWTYAVERALVLTQHYFTSPLPPGLVSALQQRRTGDERLRRFADPQLQDNRWERTVAAMEGMSWQTRWRMLRGLTFPPPRYMEWRYGIDKGWKLPFAYLRRWADAGQELLRSIR